MPVTEGAAEAGQGVATSGPPLVVEPSTAALLMRIVSPGFSTEPPDIVHPERIPPSIVEACWAQRQRVFAARDIRVWLLQDVFVACEGLVFDGAGSLYRPSITQHSPVEIGWAAEQVRAAIAGGAAVVHDLPLVLGVKRGAGNYGHWLMEMLPRLHLVLDRLRDPAVGLLLHDVSDPQLGEVMQTSLRRLGVADGRVRVAGPRPVRARALILVEGMTEHGTYMSPLVRDCQERLLHGVAGLGHDRVFVARGAGYRRNFADASRAQALAQEQRYHILPAPRLSLLQQMATLRDARVVAGAMGAGMTSLVFASTPAQALLFTGEAMPDTFFWFLANLFGHSYREVRCRQCEEPPAAGLSYDRDLLIDDDELRQQLAAA